MNIMIHCCPQRFDYADNWLQPELSRQGADEVRLYVDYARRGNLRACMDAFASCEGEGGTWHLQDDVLPARDFVERAKDYTGEHVVCGFVNEACGPDTNLRGAVYAPDMWYSFPCIYIPNRLARECAAWYRSGAWRSIQDATLLAIFEDGHGDDAFFMEFMTARHVGDTVVNLAPNLVEHIDILLGGSTVNPWRGYWARSAYWDDEERVEDVKRWIKSRVRN